MSKTFNVQNFLTVYKWILSSETKKIGNYLCYKATAIIPVTQKEKADYEEEKVEQEKSKTQFFKIEEPKDKILTAWYTPEIPVNQGPDNYWGLPGLILETNDGVTTIICSKITLNPKQKTGITIPKGKDISQKEFDILVEKKNKELENVNFNK
jgi:GLPGLI family protein